MRITNLLVIIACIGSCQAAEKLTYDQVAFRFGTVDTNLNYRAFNVTTVDGKQHKAPGLHFYDNRLRVIYKQDWWEDLPADQIARIKVTQSGKYFHHVSVSAQFPISIGNEICDGPSQEQCKLTFAALFSPVWAYTAVTAPFYLVAEAVTFFRPSKVYEIVR